MALRLQGQNPVGSFIGLIVEVLRSRSWIRSRIFSSLAILDPDSDPVKSEIITPQVDSHVLTLVLRSPVLIVSSMS